MSDTTDYKNTVFLPKTSFAMRGDLPHREPQLLDRWQKMGLYEKLRAAGSGREKFILHDGPPYANGNIHIGTALTKILKDTINRSYQMLGYDAPWVPGWDCHGLPIEWKIEEKYRAEGKDKDDVPILQFRAECRAFAAYWMNVQSEEFQRLGSMGDWKHPYSTMTHRAEAQIVREIYKFLQNGLLYKGAKPVMWSVVEKTALAEAEVEYHEHQSTTLWVKFGVVSRLGVAVPDVMANANIVIWTTTPWTLPGNRAIAYGDFSYVVLDVAALAEGATVKVGERLIVAQELLEPFKAAAKIADVKIVAELTAADLAGVVCAHPLRGGDGFGGYFDYDVPLYKGDFVTTEQGTGFVHIAPGHGEDDFALGLKYKIAFEETVGDDGRYLPNITGFAGLAVYKPDGKVGEANGAVIKALLAAGAFVAKQNIRHSYPHSWRSKAPIIFRTTPQWFIAMDKPANGQSKTLRELALEAIAETNWVPEVGENRIKGMVENRPDWCISRQRAWGVPIALFVAKKDGSVLKDQAVLDRVAAAFEKDGADAWYARPPQEFLGTDYKAEDFEQVFDIVDVWFESGSTHVFCLSPEGEAEWPELTWPADLYCEGSDQHRGWFQSSLMESCGTRGRAPFKSVVTNGFVLDEQGRKMSKSLGNVTVPQEVIGKLGADILRLWVVASDYTQDLRVGPDILKQMGDLYRRFRNSLRYLLGALEGFSDKEFLPFEQMPELEKWVLARLHEIDKTVRQDIHAYDFNHMLQELHNFCATDLSAFYFDIRKDALYCDSVNAVRRRAVRTVFAKLFEHLTLWLAPVLCFTAEEAYLARHGDTGENSVHLANFADVPASWQNSQLLDKWAKIRDVRRVLTGAMELARNEKKIGSSLEAKPTLYCSAAFNAILPEDFAGVSICSGLVIVVDEAAVPSNAFRLADVEGVAVVVELADGHKCERCWQVLPEVARSAAGLCLRCTEVVQAHAPSISRAG